MEPGLCRSKAQPQSLLVMHTPDQPFPPGLEGDSLSVLLIEPDGSLALKLQEILFGHFRASFDLATTRSLREGMAYLSTSRVAMILVDMVLPDFKGFDALRTLRLTAPSSALIAFNANNDEALLLEALSAGAHETVSIKSSSPSDWHSVLRRAMVRAGHQESASRLTSSTPSLTRLSHDLNNAITSINGFADLLLSRLPTNEPARASADQIRKAGTRAAALVKALATEPNPSPAAGMPIPHVTDRIA